MLGHDIPVDCILPLIPRLSYDKHAEVLTHFMHLLRRFVATFGKRFFGLFLKAMCLVS